MKSALCIIFISLPYFVNAQTLDFEWAKQFGSTDVKTYGRSITSDPAGNVFTLGSFKGSADFDPGPGVFTLNSGTVTSTFICKLDSSGNFLWAGKIDITGGSIVSDKYGNVFVLGTFGGTVDMDPDTGLFALNSATVYGGTSTCIVKLDNGGNFIWAKAFFGGAYLYRGCYGSSICLDAKQNIYVGGSFSSVADFDPGPGVVTLPGNSQLVQSYPSYPIPAFFICSLDSLGNFRYAKKAGNGTIPGYSSYESGDVACTPEGETIAYLTNYSANATINSATYSPKSVYFEKRGINGDLLWTKGIKFALPGTTASVFSPIATTDRHGNIWAAGYFTGLIDFDPSPGSSWNLGTPTAEDTSFFILKLNTQGNLLHASHMHRTAGKPVWLNKIFTDIEGNCYLGGSFAGTVDFDPGPSTANLTSTQSNGFLMKLGEDFQFKWTMLISENAKSTLYGICSDNFGNFYMSGGFSGSGDFNPGTGNYNMAAAGTEDAYVFKLSGPLITAIQNQELKDNVHFFPNPVSGQVYLNTTNQIDHGKCLVIDINGKIVFENHDISGKAFTINLSELQAGFYIVEISDDNYKAHAKIIKD